MPLPSPFRTVSGTFPSRLPDIVPLARSHSGTVLDTAWSPFNDSVVASGGEDGKVMIWKVESSAFDGWGQEHWVPQDFDPVSRIDGSARRIGQLLFHPTAEHVLAAASGDHVVKLWDLGSPESPKSILGGHGDAIQSLAFNAVGNVLVTTCRDRKIRMFDPRSGGDPVRVAEGHGGIKGARVVWMGEKDSFATTGFGRMSGRQVGIWDAGSLDNAKMITLDQSAGVVMPFWSDNGILFLAGKGCPCFLFPAVSLYLLRSWTEMGTFGTTSTNPIPSSPFPNTSLPILSAECASFLAAPWRWPSVRLPEPTR